mmetsp:Transcript_29672/g.57046  ORF Transcript_29672/g.57046 Transcript_29672/m.57046 type:complete len:239 (-) Transcript_29672:493-1209(-)
MHEDKCGHAWGNDCCRRSCGTRTVSGNQERGRRLIGGRFAHAYRARPPGSPCPTYHWALTGAEHNSRRAVGMWTQHGADSLWLGVPCPSRASQHEHGPHITVGTGTSGRDIGVDWYSWFQGGNGPRRKRVRFRACGSPRAQPQRWGRRPRAQPQLWNHNSKIGRTQVFAGHILHRYYSWTTTGCLAGAAASTCASKRCRSSVSGHVPCRHSCCNGKLHILPGRELRCTRKATRWCKYN